MKSLLIHIGPPKTATTSLQVFLEKSGLPNAAFVGVFQPRYEKRSKRLNKLNIKILRYVKGRPNYSQVSTIHSAFQAIWQEKDIIIYSEEIILHKESWKDNLKRLYELFNSFNPTIIYCHRDARKAIPSYYCESYGYLEKEYMKDYNSFLKSSWVEVFDISKVKAACNESGFKNFIVYGFEEFVSGKLSMNKILGQNFSDEEWSRLVIPEIRNKKSITHAGMAGEPLKYSVVLDNYKRLPKPVRGLLGSLKGVGLEVITQIIKKSMMKKFELSIPVSNELEELFSRNKSVVQSFS